MLVFDIETGPLPTGELQAAYDRLADKKKAKKSFEEFVEEAALSPTTGRVVAIGVCSTDSGKSAILSNDSNEGAMLDTWWKLFRRKRDDGHIVVGCNSIQFDLPFLVTRSWVHAVDVPAGVRDGRYWDRRIVDIRDAWLMGRPWANVESSLAHIGHTLGLGGKTEGVDGADFAKLWFGSAADRQRATEYLLRDVQLTVQCAERMGLK